MIDTQSGNQTGTYWYHSHYAGQYVDGLRAPLIIHNTPEMHQYDEEFTVSLYDWSVSQVAKLEHDAYSRRTGTTTSTKS